MVDLLGAGAFQAARASTIRPAVIPDNAPGDIDSWAVDCTSPQLADGTENRAAHINALLAQLRRVIRANGVPESNTDDEMLNRAVRRQRSNYIDAAGVGGTANAITLTPPVAFAAYGDMSFTPLRFVIETLNTGPVTITVSGLGAKALLKNSGEALVGGELVVGALAEVIYDGVAFRLQSLFGAGGSFRVRLAANLSLYVNSSTGSDTTGAGSVALPFQTLQKAWNHISANYDLNGYTIVVNCTGAFTAPLIAIGAVPGQLNQESLQFVGNIADPSAVTIGVTNAAAVVGSGSARLIIRGFFLTANGTGGPLGGVGLAASDGGSISYGNIRFGACSRAHVASVTGGRVYGMVPAQGSVIAGNAPIHAFSDVSGYIDLGATAYTFSAPATFSTAFAFAQAGGTIIAYNGVTFGAGSVTGARFNAIVGGMIDTLGGGVGFFPGTIAGGTGTGTETGFYR